MEEQSTTRLGTTIHVLCRDCKPCSSDGLPVLCTLCVPVCGWTGARGG